MMARAESRKVRGESGNLSTKQRDTRTKGPYALFSRVLAAGRLYSSLVVFKTFPLGHEWSFQERIAEGERMEEM